MNRLKELRRQKGINQGEIAKLLHITQGAVSQWELGKTSMDYQYAKALAEYFGVSVAYLLGETNVLDQTSSFIQKENAVRIPVLGTIRAGIPIAAIEDVEDWEEIPASQAKTGEFVALRVKGDSMLPDIKDGDIAIIRRQEAIDSVQIAADIVNGDGAP
ncbi:MAG: helix-turn-helix domain-containing protein, partial [Clostridia bacterium]|nr:helix-turn-helix domain-containing protein [Clostridia bacterium]